MVESKCDDFRDLEVWRQCRDIRKMFWDLSKVLPGEEKHRFNSYIKYLKGQKEHNAAKP